jgi:hypothetical protein
MLYSELRGEVSRMNQKDKKYTVSYCSGSTGYGWQKQYDRLEDFEDFVDHIRDEYTASLWVWDDELQDFIFRKDCLEFKPQIDKLHDFRRDMRTTTRMSKVFA